MKMEAGGRIDCLIHCGDGGHDVQSVAGNILQTVIVRGNNDGWSCPFQESMLLNIGKPLFFVTHGHRFGVKQDLETLADCAAAKGAQIACFGHTHVPYCGYHKGVLLINPGACVYTSRCAVITVDDKGDFTAEFL